MDINDKFVDTIYNDEVLIGKANQDRDHSDYESYLGMLDNVRDEKEYEWQSDIRIPEFVSHYLSQAAIDVRQYFQTRDFVEVKIDDVEAKPSADASKELINRTLNRRKLYHYQKFVRGKGIAGLSGRVYMKCWWEQEVEDREVGTKLIPMASKEVDINGNPLEYEWQQPMVEYEEEPDIRQIPVKDFFNYDVWDERNVFKSSDYAYSLQDKDWVIFRSEMTKSEIEDAAEFNNYNKIDDLEAPAEHTDTKQESYQKETTETDESLSESPYDVYERYGKYWVKEDKNGELTPGIDTNGDPLDDAEYKEVIITFAVGSGKKVLIGINNAPMDANNIPYRPIIMGLCYVHPNQDDGMGDGQNMREVQTAMDDTFNISQDKVMLGTLPVLIAARQTSEDNETLFLKPGHVMEAEDVGDVTDLKISDNVMGALRQLQYLEDKGRQAEAMNETTTGGVPSIASTTATAASLASQSSSIRLNYKSFTFEYTCLTELYWMIQQMTYSYAMAETGQKLMGDKLKDFDPTLEYSYHPLTQSIETEASKSVKRKELITLLQTMMQMQHPSLPKVANSIVKQIIKLMGDEYEAIVPLDEGVPAEGGGQQAQNQNVPASNQYGLPQTGEESYARE